VGHFDKRMTVLPSQMRARMGLAFRFTPRQRLMLAVGPPSTIAGGNAQRATRAWLAGSPAPFSIPGGDCGDFSVVKGPRPPATFRPGRFFRSQRACETCDGRAARTLGQPPLESLPEQPSCARFRLRSPHLPPPSPNIPFRIIPAPRRVCAGLLNPLSPRALDYCRKRGKIRSGFRR
jgi:hypothetical protein